MSLMNKNTEQTLLNLSDIKTMIDGTMGLINMKIDNPNGDGWLQIACSNLTACSNLIEKTKSQISLNSTMDYGKRNG